MDDGKKLKGHVLFDYNRINEFIYVGTDSCCPGHFKEELLDNGITADLSMEIEQIDQPQGVDYFLWLPTVDHTAPTLKQLWTGVKAMEEWEKQKIKMYVHCKNGHGRSPTMVAAYFIYAGMSVEEAITAVAKERSEIHIEEVQRSRLLEFWKELN